jgi:hypothetical protein
MEKRNLCYVSYLNVLGVDPRGVCSSFVGGNLQPGGGTHPPNPSLGRVWGRLKSA